MFGLNLLDRFSSFAFRRLNEFRGSVSLQLQANTCHTPILPAVCSSCDDTPTVSSLFGGRNIERGNKGHRKRVNQLYTIRMPSATKHSRSATV